MRVRREPGLSPVSLLNFYSHRKQHTRQVSQRETSAKLVRPLKINKRKTNQRRRPRNAKRLCWGFGARADNWSYSLQQESSCSWWNGQNLIMLIGFLPRNPMSSAHTGCHILLSLSVQNKTKNISKQKLTCIYGIISKYGLFYRYTDIFWYNSEFWHVKKITMSFL